jgi:hypothetical protein
MDPLYMPNPIAGLPYELQNLIVKKFTAKDLCNCICVSKVWKKVFESDRIWELIADQYQVTKPVFKNPIFKWLNKSEDYRSIVRLKQHEVSSKHFEFFSVLMDNDNNKLLRIPLIEFYSHIQSTTLHEKYFNSPITMAIVNWGQIYGCKYLILLRIKNNTSSEVYHEAFGIERIWVPPPSPPNGTFERNPYRFIVPFKTDHTQQIITGKNLKYTEEKKARLQRLLQGKPVGLIIRDIPLTKANTRRACGINHTNQRQQIH